MGIWKLYALYCTYFISYIILSVISFYQLYWINGNMETIYIILYLFYRLYYFISYIILSVILDKWEYGNYIHYIVLIFHLGITLTSIKSITGQNSKVIIFSLR